MNIKKILKLATTTSILFSSSSMAYQLEIGGDIGRGSYEYSLKGFESEDESETILNLNGTFYLENVQDQNAPRKEAPFLSKSSFIHGNFNKDDGNAITLDGQFLFDHNQFLFAVGEVISANNDSFKDDTIKGGIGKYLTETSSVTGTIASIDAFDDNEIVFGAEYQNLLLLTNNQRMKVNAELGIGGITTIGGGATFYPSNDIGLGINLSHNDYDDAEVDYFQFSLTGSYFILPTIEAYGQFLHEDFEVGNANIDGSTFSIGANVRL